MFQRARAWSRARSSRGHFDVRTGAPVQEMTKDEALARFAKLPKCHLPEDQACRFQRKMQGERRCLAVVAFKMSCPHLGKVEPLAKIVEDQKAASEKLKLLIEEAPKVDYS